MPSDSHTSKLILAHHFHAKYTGLALLGLRLLTFAFEQLKNLFFCIMIKGWAPQISWLGAFGHPVILLKAKP